MIAHWDDVAHDAVLAQAAGAVAVSLRRFELAPGEQVELPLFLEGGATFELWPSPLNLLEHQAEREATEVRAGHVVSRPPSTDSSHGLRAGNPGVSFLVYATWRPNDVCYYPRTTKIYWRGLGLIARFEPLRSDDGEPED